MVLRAVIILAFLSLVFAREIYKPYTDEELMKDRVVYTFNLLGTSENDQRRAKSASSEEKLARPFPKLLLLAPADDFEASLPLTSQFVDPKPIYVKKLSDPENVESQKRLIRPRRHLLLHKKLLGGLGGYGGGYEQGYGGGGYSGGYSGGYDGGYGGHENYGHGGGLSKTVIIQVTPVHGYGGYQGGHGGYQGGHGGYQGGHDSYGYQRGGHESYGGQGVYSGGQGGYSGHPVSSSCSGGCNNGGDGGGGTAHSYATATATASASASSGSGSYGKK